MKIMDLYEGTTAGLAHGVTEALPPSMTLPSMDPYYEYYRFLTSLAGYPSENIPTQSITRDIPFLVPYSPIEHEWIIKLLKKLGHEPLHLTTEPSKEPEFVNKKSTVRAFKDYSK